MSVLWIAPASLLPADAEPGAGLRLQAGPAVARAFREMVEELRAPGVWGGLWRAAAGGPPGGRLEALFRTRPRLPGLAEAAVAGWGPPTEPVGRLRRLGEGALRLGPLLAEELPAREAVGLLARLEAGEPVRLDGPLAPLRRRLGHELAAGIGALWGPALVAGAAGPVRAGLVRAEGFEPPTATV